MSKRRAQRSRPREPQTAIPTSALALLPHWEGSPGFYPVARALIALIEMPAIARTGNGVDIISGADLTAFQAIAAMYQAHPIYVGPRQLEVLPRWSTASDWDDAATALRYAAELRLPFDPLFLDFTAEDGEPCWLGEGRECGLYGALLFRGKDEVDRALVGAGQLAIVLYAGCDPPRRGRGTRAVGAAAAAADAAAGARRHRDFRRTPGAARRRDLARRVWLRREHGHRRQRTDAGDRGRHAGAKSSALVAQASYGEQMFTTPARVYVGTGQQAFSLWSQRSRRESSVDSRLTVRSRSDGPRR